MSSRPPRRPRDGRDDARASAERCADTAALARLLDWAEREARELGHAEAADRLAAARRAMGGED